MTTPTVRFDDARITGLDATIERVSHALLEAPDLEDPRNCDLFTVRAQARWARGLPAADVVDDLRMAGRILLREAGVRLHKLPPTRLKSRRLDPLHLALWHADPGAVERAGAAYGLDLMAVYAGAADPRTGAEARALSGYFASRRLGSVVDLIGLLAATYAAALAAMMRGDEKEAGAMLRLMNEAVADAAEPPDAGKRYLLQCAVLADLLGRRDDDASEHLAALVPYALAERDKALRADPDAVRSRGLGAPDLVIPALVGLATLMNVEITLRPLKKASPAIHSLAKQVERAWLQVE